MFLLSRKVSIECTVLIFAHRQRISSGQCKTNFLRMEHKIRIHNSNRKNFLGPGNFSHLTASLARGVVSLGSRKSKRGFTFLAFRRVLLFTLYRLLITLSTSYAYCKSLLRRRLGGFSASLLCGVFLALISHFSCLLCHRFPYFGCDVFDTAACLQQG